MKESKILGTFQQHGQAIQQLNQQIMMIGTNANKIIGNLAGNITNISLVVDSILEYEKKYWILPRGFFPGNKLFSKIYNRRVNEIRKQHEEALKKQKEAQEAAQNGPVPSGVVPE
jgi:F0F1-type ATP synthase membrane subunit b/b'